ncbi:MAG: minichromosome maintenance protein MCM [Candidatus Nanoarchaeia archaeon]|nr:minichromosome maintenance protein MCM [Candidatus Nanoarchaeia archaeon]
MDVQEQIEKFQEFLREEYEKELHKIIKKGEKSIVIDFQSLALFSPELSDLVLEDPEETLKAAEIAIQNLDLTKQLIRVRLSNLPKSQEVKIRDIRSIHINKLMAFEGVVRQSSDVRPQVISAKFECPSCGNTLTMLQLESKFREPYRCSCGRKGRFRLVSKELVDAQRLVLEESAEYLEGGEQPKRLAIFLKEDLVEPKMERKTTPGSKIRFIGLIKEIPVMLSTGVQSIRYDLVGEANNVESVERTYEDIEINEEDVLAIQTLAKDKNVYEKLTNTMAPSIYGYPEVKLALVLQLMGGTKKVRKDGTRTRGDMHVLLVGDPGSGKSQLLQFIAKCAPKAKYISGKGASAAGLTASVVRDEFIKGWALEAGALVLANKGIACLDELDKVSVEDTSALHEAMEQQTITIAKANIQATLKSETTILAAANPKLARFDPFQLIASQINMPPTLINRFDLIFPIRDIPNKEVDTKIASHILKIQQDPEEVKYEVPLDLLKKFIAYARQNSSPKLSEQAVDEIKSFYVGLRSSAQSTGDEIKPIPISARQLEALVRLTEASAKVRLAKKAMREDARRAIELLKYCLMQVGYDYETGQIDIDRISTGIPASQRSKILIVKEIISELSEKIGKAVPVEDLISYAAEKGIDDKQIDEIIERLKRDGEIFEPKRGFLAKI